MILRGIVKVIKTIVDGLAAVIAWLLVALGLWIPAVYVLAYVVICAVTGIPVTGNMAVFWIGLVMSAVLSVTFAFSRLKRKKKPRETAQAEANLPKLKKREPRVTMDNGSAFDDDLIGRVPSGEAEAVFAQPTPKKGRERKSRDSGRDSALPESDSTSGQRFDADRGEARDGRDFVKSHNELRRAETTMSRDNNRDLEEKYFGADEKSLADGPDRRSDLPRFYESGAGRYERAREEQPLIFRLRGDPTVYVCEYSDRLEYYKRTRAGMELMKKEYKSSRMIDG